MLASDSFESRIESASRDCLDLFRKTDLPGLVSSACECGSPCFDGELLLFEPSRLLLGTGLVSLKARLLAASSSGFRFKRVFGGELDDARAGQSRFLDSFFFKMGIGDDSLAVSEDCEAVFFATGLGGTIAEPEAFFAIVFAAAGSTPGDLLETESGPGVAESASADFFLTRDFRDGGGEGVARGGGGGASESNCFSLFLRGTFKGAPLAEAESAGSGTATDSAVGGCRGPAVVTSDFDFLLATGLAIESVEGWCITRSSTQEGNRAVYSEWQEAVRVEPYRSLDFQSLVAGSNSDLYIILFFIAQIA